MAKREIEWAVKTLTQSPLVSIQVCLSLAVRPQKG